VILCFNQGRPQGRPFSLRVSDGMVPVPDRLKNMGPLLIIADHLSTALWQAAVS